MSDVLPRLTTALESTYRVTRQIGVGGMATVYLAHDIRHERDVAIKVLHPDLAAALGAERFLAEIKTTAKLQHPHILYLVSLDAAGRAAPRVLIGGAGSQDDARMSPDGQWVIYTSVESGRTEVYLVPYPLDRGPARQQLSVAGSAYAVWGSDGRTVFYDAGGKITRVRIDPRTGEIGKPEVMRRLQAPIGWTIGPDGRFLIGKIAQGGERRPLKVILNWVSTLRSN